MRIGEIFKTNQGCTATVIRYNDSRSVFIRYNDSYGYEAEVIPHQLSIGAVKNPYHPIVCGVGFFGVGGFSSKKNGRRSCEYSAWNGMMERCYSEKSRKKYSSYIGCSVHEDWHNFQVFARWFTSHKHYDLGYDLDKDLLIAGNRIYSESTCCLIPPDLNKIISISRNKESDLPVGVSFLKKVNRYRARLCVAGKQVELGWFKDVNDAKNAYRKAKESRVKKEALRWRSVIDPNVFDALMSWSVD